MLRFFEHRNLTRCAFVLAATFSLSFLSACQTTSPKDSVMIGNELAKDGLLREAAASYRKALRKNDRNATAHRNLGMVLVKLGDFRGAIKHLEKSIGAYEKDFDANFYLGEANRAENQFAEAIFRYKQALTIRPRDTRALKPLAWSYFKIRYYTEALSVARQLQKISPRDDQVGIILSRTLLKLKRPREALGALSRARKTSTRRSQPYFNSVEGDIRFALKDHKGAIKAYRAALKDQPLLAGALLGLGRCLMDVGKTKRAIAYMERAVRIRPRLTEAHYLLGKAYEATDKRKALRYYKYFRRQAAADPEFLDRLGEVKNRIAALQTGR